MAPLYQFPGIRIAAELVWTQKEPCPDFARHDSQHVLVPADVPSRPQTSREQAVQRPFDCEWHLEGTGAWPATWGTGRVRAAHLEGMNTSFHRNMFTATEILLAVCIFSGLLLQASVSWKEHKKPSWAQKELLMGGEDRG